jgi:RTX calcium-binding nonapeptide repeat (4 copies)
VALTDILAALQFGGFERLKSNGEGVNWQPNAGWTTSERTQVELAIGKAYNGSEQARNLMEAWVASGRELKFANVAGADNFYAFKGDNTVYVDLPALSRLQMFNAKGFLFDFDLPRTLLHEMHHAWTEKGDGIFSQGIVDSELLNATAGASDQTGLMGPTVDFENAVASQIDNTTDDLNYARYRVSYKAVIGSQSIPTEMVGKSWTGDRIIDVALVDGGRGDSNANFKFTGQSMNGSRDLVLGLGGNDYIDGGKGDDYLYGGKGDDWLIGGGGSNWLVGGDGSDLADYSKITDQPLIFSQGRFTDVNGGDQFDKDVIRIGHSSEEGSGGAGTDTVRGVEFIKATNKGEQISLESLKSVDLSDNATNKFDADDGTQWDVQLQFELEGGNDSVAISGAATAYTSGLTKVGLGLDGGEQEAGGSDKLDFTGYTHAGETFVLKFKSYGATTTATFNWTGVDVQGNNISSSNISFKNFEKLTGTAQDDYVVDTQGLKNIFLGTGNDYVAKVSGSVLPEQIGNAKPELLHWVYIDVGTGADVVDGGIAKGSEVYLGDDGDRDLMQMNDQVRVHQLKDQDQLFLGAERMTGGTKNKFNKDPHAYHISGTLRYVMNSDGELVIEDMFRRKMWIADYDIAAAKTKGAGGLTIAEISLYATQLLKKPDDISVINAFDTLGGTFFKAMYGFSITTGVPDEDPLVLDLNRNGRADVSLYDSLNWSHFDTFGTGFRNTTAWIENADGMVVPDANGNGQIDSVAEMVGHTSGQGLTDLAAYDSNGDGKVDAAEAAAAGVKIWVDANYNGVTDAGELRSFTEAGIASISTARTAANVTVNDSRISGTGTFTFADGTSFGASEVILRASNYDTQWRGDTSITPGAAALPELKGHGTIMDLRVAMSHDPRHAADGRTQLEKLDGIRDAGPATHRETSSLLLTLNCTSAMVY